MRKVSWYVLALVAAGLGCRSEQLAHDQDHIRSAVLDLQTNQIMDNLIRIRRGLPIIQLDYGHMTGTVTDTATAGMSGSDTNVGVHSIPFKTVAVPAFAAITRTFTSVFAYSAGGTQVKQLTINAEPVLNAPEVYNAYLEFLKDPSHLLETDVPPPPDEVLVVRCRERDCCDPGCGPRKCHHKIYYWVPCEYRADFFKLALYVIAVRGQATPMSPNFDVTIKGFKDAKDLPVKGGYEATMVIDKKIPNDNGYVIATISGRILDGPQDLQLRKVAPAKADEGAKNVADTLSEPSTTDEFRLSFNVNTLPIQKLTRDDVLKALTGQKVGIRLEHFFSTVSPTDRLLEDIRYQLELNRLGQFQLAH